MIYNVAYAVDNHKSYTPL